MYACVILASIYSKLASPKNLAGPAVEYSISSLDCVEVVIGWRAVPSGTQASSIVYVGTSKVKAFGDVPEHAVRFRIMSERRMRK